MSVGISWISVKQIIRASNVQKKYKLDQEELCTSFGEKLYTMLQLIVILEQEELRNADGLVCFKIQIVRKPTQNFFQFRNVI